MHAVLTYVRFVASAFRAVIWFALLYVSIVSYQESTENLGVAEPLSITGRLGANHRIYAID